MVNYGKWVLVLPFTLIAIIILTGCHLYNDDAEHLLEIKPSPTLELQPTQTSRSTPQGHYCNGATASGARTAYTFEEITPCLDTIEKVSDFMKNNMMYDSAYDAHERSSNEYVPAYLVYERGVDDCDGHAILQCYFLEKNGFNAVMLRLSIDTPTGWNTCAVTTKDGVFVLDEMGEILGPFGSIEEAARQFISPDLHLGSLLASQVTQITTNDSTPNVLSFPWKMIWK